MKSYLTPLLFSVASLVAISANAGAPNYFIPSEPTITAPADQATDVAITPELVSSDFEFTETYEPSNDPALSASKWLSYQSDESIDLLGGKKLSYSNYHQSDFEYAIPFPINISGQLATKIRVNSSGDIRIVEILNVQNTQIARAFLELNEFDFQPNMNFVVVKKFSSSLQLQWNLINEQGVEITAEFILFDNGNDSSDVFGWRTTPNEYTNSLFDSSNSAAACRVSTDNINTSQSSFDKDFDTWKDLLSENYDKFFLACTSSPKDGGYEIQLKELNIVDVTNFLPEINFYTSSTENITLSDAERLNASTKYTTQVQHIGAEGQLIAASSWSAPVSFTTRAADTNYQVTTPTDLAFTVGVAKNLTFKVSNTGSEAGSPQVTIRLPFEALNVVNGTVKDFFSVSIGNQDCEMTQSAGQTDFVCQLDSLAAATEVQLATKITAENDAVKSIEYQVCDLDKCDDTPFTTVNISVTDAEAATQSPAASSSSSSGGSMFWLLLMAPLLLVRRK